MMCSKELHEFMPVMVAGQQSFRQGEFGGLQPKMGHLKTIQVIGD